jgi:hypothetical protein
MLPLQMASTLMEEWFRRRGGIVCFHHERTINYRRACTIFDILDIPARPRSQIPPLPRVQTIHLSAALAPPGSISTHARHPPLCQIDKYQHLPQPARQVVSRLPLLLIHVPHSALHQRAHDRLVSAHTKEQGLKNRPQHHTLREGQLHGVQDEQEGVEKR